MRLSELYRNKSHIDISIELFPPKTTEGAQKLFEKVEELRKRNPAFFSMTYGAGGSTSGTTLELVDRLKNKIGVETMCHLTVSGQTKKQISSVLDRLQAMGVYNLIALRGDAPKESIVLEDGQGFKFARELVLEAKKRNYFSIAVAGFPETHPDSKSQVDDIRYLKEKVDAGADVIITQLFFDDQYFYRYLDLVRKAGIKVPVIPGLLPILSVKQVRRFTELCKSKIPPAVETKLSKYENDDAAARAYGIELATQQCRDLLTHGVPGLHFYALNLSHSVESVLKNLNL